MLPGSQKTHKVLLQSQEILTRVQKQSTFPLSRSPLIKNNPSKHWLASDILIKATHSAEPQIQKRLLSL